MSVIAEVESRRDADRSGAGAAGRAPLSRSERNATREPVKFALLLGQLAAIVFVFRTFSLVDPSFVQMLAIATVGFAVHYWLPFSWKKPFFIFLSITGAFALRDPIVVGLLLVAAFLFYAILSLPIAYGIRAAIVAAIGVAAFAARGVVPASQPLAEVLRGFWPIFGAIFMFRMIIYVYDVRHTKQRGTLQDYLAYFLVLPNFVLLLFPVIDYQTMRTTYYSAEFHKQGQEGLRWMARGTLHLLLYRVIYHLRPNPSPEDVTTFAGLIAAMVMTYMLYLRFSGLFHIAIGMLHLFGFNLPETNRRYFLAASLTDMWRRINIYWKDFMVKVFYFPLYFRLRKYGETRATAIATMTVFLLTWFLHVYQFYWLSGVFLIALHDVLFWTILGGLVIVNVLRDMKPQAAMVTGLKPGRDLDRHVLKVLLTFSFMTVLWSMWNAKSLSEWLAMLTYWTNG